MSQIKLSLNNIIIRFVIKVDSSYRSSLLFNKITNANKIYSLIPLREWILWIAAQQTILCENRYWFAKLFDDVLRFGTDSPHLLRIGTDSTKQSTTLREVIPKSARVIWPSHSFHYFAYFCNNFIIITDITHYSYLIFNYFSFYYK